MSAIFLQEGSKIIQHVAAFILSFSAILGALWGIYTMGGKKLLKWAKNKLFEDVNNMCAEILANQKQHGEQMDKITTQLSFVSVSQKVVFEKNKVMWWRSGEDGFTTEVGGYTVKYLQVPEERLKGVNWVSHIPNEEHPAIMAEFQRALESKSDFNITYTFIRGDGSKVRLNAHATYADRHWFGVLEPAS